jgi:CPA2 family monovalent cation:H+ antiporter-2
LFGVLFLQDLTVVQLLVITPILAGGGEGLASAGALGTIAVIGKFLLKPFFDTVAKAKSQEVFVQAVLASVLGMSFLTDGLGGLFFFSFEIDLDLIASIVFRIASLKAVTASALDLTFGFSKGTATRDGLMLSQGGEFAFVDFKLARSYGILSDGLTKLMLTYASLTMGLTPFFG